MTKEEAIENLKGLLESSYVDRFEDAENEALDMAIKALKQEPRWIPVSERLPSDNKEVLVYLNACPYIAWFEAGKWWTEDFVIDKDFEPIAWMPLPLPYKAESEE
jgi:hypothetical protein